jgi:aminopeptidase N
VHRIEDGGTEFPMMVMDGSAAERLIVHEVAHNYVMGVLANNEWRQGWLDEGFAQFLTNWYSERQGLDAKTIWGSAMQSIRELERAGRTQPIAMASAAFRDFATYNAMTYTKPSLVYRMLRWLLGEETYRQGLRLYFERNALRHVREEDLRAAFEAAAGRDLRWFFLQWIHTTATLDYRVASARTRQLADGAWETTVEVTREGDAYMPVELKVGSDTRRLESRAATQTVTVRTAERPAEVVLDPDDVLLDIQPDNNRMDVS